MTSNFGDFQMGVYLDAVKGVNSRYPFDFQSIETEGVRGAARLGVPICLGGGRRRADSARQHRCIFTLRDHSPDDGQPARA